MTPDATLDEQLVEARATVFGQRPTAATLAIRARPTRVRSLRTALALFGTAVVTPLAFLVPPHAPWGVGALVGGLFATHRQWAIDIVSYAWTRPARTAERPCA